MKKILLPGIVIGIVTFIIGMLLTFLFGAIIPGLTDEYSSSCFRAIDDPLMMLFYLYPLILGIALAWFWDKAKSLYKGSSSQRALKLAWTYFIIATIPGMYISYTSFEVSFMMVLTWLIGGFINAFVAGLILTKMNK